MSWRRFVWHTAVDLLAAAAVGVLFLVALFTVLAAFSGLAVALCRLLGW